MATLRGPPVVVWGRLLRTRKPSEPRYGTRPTSRAALQIVRQAAHHLRPDHAGDLLGHSSRGDRGIRA